MSSLNPKYWATVIAGGTTIIPTEERIGITDPTLFVRSEIPVSRNPAAPNDIYKIAYVERLPETNSMSWKNSTSGTVVRLFELVGYPSHQEIHRFVSSLVGFPFTALQVDLTEVFKGLNQDGRGNGDFVEQDIQSTRQISFYRVGRHLPDRLPYIETYGVLDNTVYKVDNGNEIKPWDKTFLHCTQIESVVGRGARGSKVIGTNTNTRLAMLGHPDAVGGTGAEIFRDGPVFENVAVRAVYEMLPFPCRTRTDEMPPEVSEFNRYVVKKGNPITETLSIQGDKGVGQIIWDTRTLAGEPPPGKKQTAANYLIGQQYSVVISRTDLQWLWFDVPAKSFNFAYIEACYNRVNALEVTSLENGQFFTYAPETLLLVHCARRPTRSVAGVAVWELEFRFLYQPNYGSDGQAKGANWFVTPSGFYQRITRATGDSYYKTFHFPDLFRNITA